MNRIFICNTPYQVFVAYHIAGMKSEGESNKIIISDHFKAAYKIYNRIKENSQFFTEAYYVETCEWQNMNYPWRERIEKCRDDCISLVRKLDLLNNDRIIYSSRDVFTINALEYVIKEREDVILEVMEDGFATYSFDKAGYDKRVGLEARVEKFHLFHPEKMSWKPRAELERIDTKLCNVDRFIGELNRVFGIQNTADDYRKKFIFFESGLHGWENKKCFDLVETIGRYVGKDNLLIKMHPRNQGDDFIQKLGYEINTNYEVPWELIALNIDIHDKVLISDFSSCVATANFLFEKNYSAIVLCDLLKTSKIDDELVDYLKKYIYTNNNIYFIPRDKDELISRLVDQYGG